MILRLYIFMVITTLTQQQSFAPQFNPHIDHYLKQKIKEDKIHLRNIVENEYSEGNGPQLDAARDNFLDDESNFLDKVPDLDARTISTWCHLPGQDYRLIIGTTNGTVYIFQLEKGAFVLFETHETGITINKIQALLYFKKLRFIVHGQESSRDFIQVYSSIDFRREQFISFSHRIVFEVFHFNNSHYMAVSAGRGMLGPRFLLYRWEGTQFDKIIEKDLENSSSFATWDINGILYISTCLANEFSPIFSFSPFQKETLHLVQHVKVSYAALVEHFFVHNSQYLVFSTSKSADIFWWAGNEFLQWQTLVLDMTAKVIDIHLFKLNDIGVILAFISKHEIQFFVQDATLHFVHVMIYAPLKMSELFSSWMLLNEVVSAKLSSLQFLLKLKHLARSITEIKQLEPLSSCLAVLKTGTESLGHKLKEIDALMDTIWFRNGNKNVQAKVAIEGSVITKGYLKAHMVITEYSEEPLNDPYEVSNYTLNLMTTTAVLDLQNIVSKSTPQSISTNVAFHLPFGVTNGEIRVLQQDVMINDVFVHQLLSTLRTKDNAMITSNVLLTNVTTNEIYIENGLMNKINIADMVLIHGEQEINGFLQFASLHGNDMNIRSQGVLNGLEMTSLITIQGDQEIHDRKTFDHLFAHEMSIKTSFYDGNFVHYNRSMVFLDTEEWISSGLHFTSTVNIGNMRVTGPFGDKLSDVIDHAVKSVEDGKIGGQKLFLSPIDVHEMFLWGNLNNMELESIMTTTTNQTVSGNVAFDDIAFDVNLLLNHLNKLNLEECCLLQKDLVHIEGHKLFLKDIETVGISLAENATLDFVDPSELVLQVFPRIHGMELTNPVFLRDVSVRDLHVFKMNVPLQEIACCVWLRNTVQVIPHPVLAENIVFQDVGIEYVNGLDLENDVLLTKADSHITSYKTFENVNVLGSFETSEGVMVNDMHLPSLLASLKLSNFQVMGNITIQNVVVNGNAELQKFNGFNFREDLMFCCRFQNVKSAFFTWITMKELSAERIAVELINDRDFNYFVSRAVLATSPINLLSDKTFSILKGSSMISYGDVDGVNLTKFFAEAVSTNCSQIVVQKTFIEGLQTFHMTTVASINGFNYQALIQNVIFKDETKPITGRKRFTQMAFVNELVYSGYINGLNLLYLQENALSKLGDINIFAPMYFNKEITMLHDLEIQSDVLLDGIFLHELVLLRADYAFSNNLWFNDVRTLGNFVNHGMINSCNLTKVFNTALYMSSPGSQVIKAAKQIEFLTVNGHFTTLHSMNEINFNELVNVSSQVQKNISGTFHFQSVAVNQVFIGSKINGISLSNIFTDAVLKSETQVIYGVKESVNLSVNNIFAVDIFCHKFLNGVNVQDLFETTVRIENFQRIQSNLKFPSFHSLSISVKGTLNGVQIPVDVILINTTEVIYGKTLINGTMQLDSSLTIHGRLDREHLGTSIPRLIFLDTQEVVYSSLYFQEHVAIQGDFSVFHWNNISIKDVVLLSNHSVLRGSKTFQELAVMRNVSAHIVNGVNITDLSHSSLQINEDAHVNKLVFFAPLQVSSMTVSWLNGNMSPTEMHHQIRSRMKESAELSLYLDATVEQIDALLHFQTEASSYHILQLAYFDLYQEINVNSSLKFLLICEAGFHKNTLPLPLKHMIMWSEDSKCTYRSRCCNIFISRKLSVDMNGYLTEMKTYSGKVIHFKLKQTKHHVRGFHLRASVKTSSKSCVRHNVTIKTIFLTRVFKLPPFTLDIFGDQLVMAEFLEVEGDVFVIVGYSKAYEAPASGVALYKYIWVKNQWEKQQQVLQFDTPTAMAIHKGYLDNIQLVIGYNGTISVFHWDGHEQIFYPSENISRSMIPSAIQWVPIGEELFLFLASEKTYMWSNTTSYSDPILIYRFRGKDLVFSHTIEVGGIYAMDTFNLLDETYVVAVCRYLQIVYLIQWKGYSGFRVVQDIFAPGVETVTSFTTQLGEIMLAIASTNGHTRTWKAAIRGTRAQLELN